MSCFIFSEFRTFSAETQDCFNVITMLTPLSFEILDLLKTFYYLVPIFRCKLTQISHY